MNHEDYCSYEISSQLRKKGFNYWTNSCYPYVSPNKRINKPVYSDFNAGCRNLSAPTLYQSQKWLREVKGIEVYIIPHKDRTYKTYIDYNKIDCDGTYDITETLGVYTSYVDALSAGITKALEMI